MSLRSISRVEMIDALSQAEIQFPPGASATQLRPLYERLMDERWVEANSIKMDDTAECSKESSQAVPTAADEITVLGTLTGAPAARGSVDEGFAATSTAVINMADVNNTVTNTAAPEPAAINPAVILTAAPNSAAINTAANCAAAINSAATDVAATAVPTFAAGNSEKVDDGVNSAILYSSEKTYVNKYASIKSAATLDDEIKMLQKRRELLLLRREVESLEGKRLQISSSDLTTIDNLVGRFSGDDVYDVKKWIFDLEDAFGLLSLDEHTKLVGARRLLDGTAKMFARTVVASNYCELKSALLEEFGQSYSMLDVYEQLRNRHLKPDESLQRYFMEMKAIAEKADIPERELVDAIIAGLNEKSSLVTILYQANTLKQLRVQLDRYEKLRPKVSYALRSQRVADTKMRVMSSSGQVAMDNPRCFNCSQFGHFQSQCTKPKRQTGSCFKCGEMGHYHQACPKKANMVAAVQDAALKDNVTGEAIDALQLVTIGRRIGLYRFCGDIGRGNFSKVKLAVHQLTRDKVAIKVVDRGGLDTKALRMLSSEIATLECVHHPHILRLFEVVETLGRVYLVTEWIRGGELYNHITQGGPLREIHAAPLYKQLLQAVKHMHTLGFVHRDIKAENVLLLSEDRLKLADFGFSTQLLNGANQKLDTFCGSPPYAAPELFSDDHYIGAPVDVWALGILLYFMVVGNMPFRAPTIPGLKAAILKGDYLLPGQLSLPCIRLIQRTLIHLPARRPTIEEMLDSQFVTYPKLSAELMQHEINLRSKPAQRSGFWMRSKSRRMRKTYSLRERYMEVTNKPPLNLNTKKNDGSLVDNFLHPIEVIQDLQQYSNKESSRTNTPKKYFFCGSLKKKVSPMDPENEMHLSNGTKNTSCDNRQWNAAVGCPLFKNYDIESGNFIMHPTNTCDLDHLSPLEVEARKILEELGVTSEMLKAAIQNGPRSEIIGAYRIIVNRLQKQSWLARKHVEIALQEIPKAERKFERSCCIL